MNQQEKKKIVLINQVTGYLFIDIANELAKKYDEVVLLAGSIQAMEHPLDQKIKIHKIKKYVKKTTATRMISWVAAFFQIFFLIKFKYRKHDLFISSNPPLATLLPAFCKNTSSLYIYDIYPDGLVATNFLKKDNFIIKGWARLNRVSYKRVSHIFTLTEGMSNLMEQYVEKSKLIVVPAWSSNVFHSNNARISSNGFIEKYNLQNKFLVVYSGNLGKEYELETLVYLADRLKETKNIMFLIIGEGWKKAKLEALVAEYDLSNCRVLPYQPANLFIHLMDAMHLGVVSLGKAVSKIAIPSKTYNILASGKPVLCIGSKDSDLAAMITKYEVGAAFLSDEIEQASLFIERMASQENNDFAEVCLNAKKASIHFTSDNAEKIANLITQ